MVALASDAQCCPLIHFQWVILLPNSVQVKYVIPPTQGILSHHNFFSVAQNTVLLQRPANNFSFFKVFSEVFSRNWERWSEDSTYEASKRCGNGSWK